MGGVPPPYGTDERRAVERTNEGNRCGTERKFHPFHLRERGGTRWNWVEPCGIGPSTLAQRVEPSGTGRILDRSTKAERVDCGTRCTIDAFHPAQLRNALSPFHQDQENMFRPKYNLMMLNLVVNDLSDIIIERPHYDWWCSCETNSSNSWATWVRFLGSWSHYRGMH